MSIHNFDLQERNTDLSHDLQSQLLPQSADRSSSIDDSSVNDHDFRAPLWAKLAGYPDFHEESGAKFYTAGWTCYNIVYFLGVWGMNVFVLVMVCGLNYDEVFGVFTVVVPSTDLPTDILKPLQFATVLVSSVTHPLAHIFVYVAVWRPRVSG